MAEAKGEIELTLKVDGSTYAIRVAEPAAGGWESKEGAAKVAQLIYMLQHTLSQVLIK